MRRALGVVAVLVGVVWFFQGIGVLKGSSMTGEGLWTFLGLVFIGAGIRLLIVRPVSDE